MGDAPCKCVTTGPCEIKGLADLVTHGDAYFHIAHETFASIRYRIYMAYQEYVSPCVTRILVWNDSNGLGGDAFCSASPGRWIYSIRHTLIPPSTVLLAHFHPGCLWANARAALAIFIPSSPAKKRLSPTFISAKGYRTPFLDFGAGMSVSIFMCASQLRHVRHTDSDARSEVSIEK